MIESASVSRIANGFTIPRSPFFGAVELDGKTVRSLNKVNCLLSPVKIAKFLKI